MKRGQDKGIDPRQQFQHVVALAEELEPVAQRQFGVTCVEGGAQRSSSYRGDPEREPAIGDGPSRIEQHLVSLLGSQVGHGHEEQLAGFHAEFGPHVGPQFGPSGHQGVRPGQVDAVHHRVGPASQRGREGIVGRLRHRHQPFVLSHRGPQQRPDHERLPVPQAVLGVHDTGSGGAGQGSHDQLAESGRVREVEVDHVVVPLHQDAAEGRHPPQVGVVGGTEGMHRRSAPHDGRHQRVQVPEHVGHLVVEPAPVTYRHHVDQ